MPECPQCQMPVEEFQFADKDGEHYFCRCGCSWVDGEEAVKNVGRWVRANDPEHLMRCALADLEGIMPEFEPSGDRTHPGWRTVWELRNYLEKEDE